MARKPKEMSPSEKAVRAARLSGNVLLAVRELRSFMHEQDAREQLNAARKLFSPVQAVLLDLVMTLGEL